MPKTSPASLRIYNLRGEQIRELLFRTLPTGTHQIEWDARTDSGEPVPAAFISTG